MSCFIFIKRKPRTGRGYLEVVMSTKNDERKEWRHQLVLELLKTSVVYGKKTIDELVIDAKKIEEYVYSENS